VFGLNGIWVPHLFDFERVRFFRSHISFDPPRDTARENDSPMLHDPFTTQNHLTPPNAPRTINPMSNARRTSKRVPCLKAGKIS
jgi:hypothetical protein